MYLPESGWLSLRRAPRIGNSLPNGQGRGRLHIRHRGREKSQARRERAFFLRQHSRKRLPTRLEQRRNSLPPRVRALRGQLRRLVSTIAVRPVSGPNEPERQPPRESSCVPPSLWPWPGWLPVPPVPGLLLEPRRGIAGVEDVASRSFAHWRAESCFPLRRSDP